MADSNVCGLHDKRRGEKNLLVYPSTPQEYASEGMNKTHGPFDPSLSGIWVCRLLCKVKAADKTSAFPSNQQSFPDRSRGGRAHSNPPPKVFGDRVQQMRPPVQNIDLARQRMMDMEMEMEMGIAPNQHQMLEQAMFSSLLQEPLPQMFLHQRQLQQPQFNQSQFQNFQPQQQNQLQHQPVQQSMFQNSVQSRPNSVDADMCALHFKNRGFKNLVQYPSTVGEYELSGMARTHGPYAPELVGLGVCETPCKTSEKDNVGLGNIRSAMKRSRDEVGWGENAGNQGFSGESQRGRVK